MYPKNVIDNQIETFLDKQFTVGSGAAFEKQKTLHYSLPYIGHFSHVTKKKLKHICERFCKDIDISIAFSPLVVFSVVRTPYLNLFSPMSFISLLVQNVKPVILVRLSCHLITRIEEHLGKDKKSYIYSHLQQNPQCQKRVNFDCFEIIDCASFYFRLQFKEAMHIYWKKSDFNKQVKHVGITISI